MTETRDLRSVLEAAEQAANAGNYAAAEPLLREAALLLEASLGPLHPDLANTLNNLAVVCELTGKMGDAEEFYRRAYAIASTFPPADELRATSERNLRDFCKARGRPFELLQEPPAAALEREARAAAPAPAPIERPTPAVSQMPRATQPVAAEKSAPISEPTAVAKPAAVSKPAAVTRPAGEREASRRSEPSSRVGILVGAVLLLLSFIVGFFWFRADAPDSSTPVNPTPAAQATPTPSSPAAVATPTPVPPAARVAPAPVPPVAAVTPNPAPPTAPPASRDAVAEPKSPTPRPSATGAAPDVVSAQLCRGLSRGGAWRCTPANSPVDPGRLFFYTRLKALRGTTVHHRWYRGDRLIQEVELRIQPNAREGFRTYSQNTVNAGSGDWRVELAAANGAVLHEVRFVVR